MADLGTVQLFDIEQVFKVVTNYTLASPLQWGAVQIFDVGSLLTTIGTYGLGGTTPTGPSVPTTGQIWPRGNP